MPKVIGFPNLMRELLLSIKAARLDEERIQALGKVCHDPHELRRIEADRDAEEEAQDALISHALKVIYGFEQVTVESQRQVDRYLLAAQKSEPTAGELRQMAAAG